MMRQNHETLSEAMAAAEWLVDYTGEREPAQKKGWNASNQGKADRTGSPSRAQSNNSGGS